MLKVSRAKSLFTPALKEERSLVQKLSVFKILNFVSKLTDFNYFLKRSHSSELSIQHNFLSVEVFMMCF